MGDPAARNTWGTTLNTDMGLIDSAVAGTLPLSVAGASDVILTSVAGAADQSRNQHFVFTGLLTGNITVYWPNALGRDFSVQNSTTGSFTLRIAVNNGGGSPAGSTVLVAQGKSDLITSDGTNMSFRQTDSAALGGPFLQLSGGAMTGALTINSSAAFSLNGAAATNRLSFIQTATSNRWLYGANALPESGANAGSDFIIDGYADDGTTILGTYVSINRATGVASLSALPSWPSSAHSLGGNGYQYLPNGLILQWGRIDTSGGNLVTFPVAFTTVYRMTATSYQAGPGVALGLIAQTYGGDLTGRNVILSNLSGVAAPGLVDWEAVGY